METDVKVFRTHSSAYATKESFYLSGRATNVSTWLIAIRSVTGGIDIARVTGLQVQSPTSSPSSLTALSSTVVDPPRYYARLVRTRDTAHL